MDTHENAPQFSDRLDRSIWPVVFSEDPHALRRFMAGLGFEEGIVVPGEGGGHAEGPIMHSEMLWPEGGRVMVASYGVADDLPTTGTTNVYVVTDRPDEVHARAVRLGATITRPLHDETSFVSRGFSLRDPHGNGWSFGTYGG